MTGTLTAKQATALESCEQVIRERIHSFMEVGNALMKIRDLKLYRDSHKTFEAYCVDRWNLARRTAYQLIDASVVVENVRNCAQTPLTESVVRPLTKLQPEDQKAAWKEAVETAPNGKVTAKHVEKTAKRFSHPSDPNIIQDDEETNRRVAEAAEDSNKLWTLKTAWRRAGEKDRKAFVKWELFDSWFNQK